MVLERDFVLGSPSCSHEVAEAPLLLAVLPLPFLRLLLGACAVPACDAVARGVEARILAADRVDELAHLPVHVAVGAEVVQLVLEKQPHAGARQLLFHGGLQRVACIGDAGVVVLSTESLLGLQPGTGLDCRAVHDGFLELLVRLFERLGVAPPLVGVRLRRRGVR